MSDSTSGVCPDCECILETYGCFEVNCGQTVCSWLQISEPELTEWFRSEACNVLNGQQLTCECCLSLCLTPADWADQATPLLWANQHSVIGVSVANTHKPQLKLNMSPAVGVLHGHMHGVLGHTGVNGLLDMFFIVLCQKTRLFRIQWEWQWVWIQADILC